MSCRLSAWLLLLNSVGGLALVDLKIKEASQAPAMPEYFHHAYCTPEITSKLYCDKLPAICLKCNFTTECKLGEDTAVTCEPLPDVVCKLRDGYENSQGILQNRASCRYCWQLPPENIQCEPVTNCSVTAAPPDRHVTTTCWAAPDSICMGRRAFYRKTLCNWTNGYKWSTALLLSITLGGFGADRFYLGLWREGLGKLFSFGGLGVWTLVDVVLIGAGYIGPADGSLYM